MKYCTSCGAEMFDDAVMCTKCGRMAMSPISNKTSNPQANADSSAQANLIGGECKSVSVLNFVSTMTIAVALFALISAVANPYVDISESGYYYKYYSAYYYPDNDLATTALIFSIASFGLGLATMITAIVKRQRSDRLFSSISKLVFGVLLIIASAGAL